MTKGLWKRVQQIAREREISNLRLRELMADRGLRYDPIYMDSFAYPDDIHVLAEILHVPSSRLFEATSYLNELLDSLVEEKWTQHESRMSISKEEALARVMESEYRWNSPELTIRDQVELVLKALGAPSSKRYGCQYPDCDCTTRCAITGRMIGPEG